MPSVDGLNIIRKTLGQNEIATLQSTSVDGGIAWPALARRGQCCSAEGAAVWTRRILLAKNTLLEADARQVEEAFVAKLTTINGQSSSALCA
jgi:hypothetical protein